MTSNGDLPRKLQVRAGQRPRGRTRGAQVTAELCNPGEKLRQSRAGDRGGKKFLLLSWARASGSVSHPELPWLRSKDYCADPEPAPSALSFPTWKTGMEVRPNSEWVSARSRVTARSWENSVQRAARGAAPGKTGIPGSLFPFSSGLQGLLSELFHAGGEKRGCSRSTARKSRVVSHR